MLMPVIIFYLLFLMHAMGAGDIKLFMALSCMTDYSIVLHTIIFSLCLAAVYGLFRLIRQGTLIQRILYFRTYMQSSLVKKQWDAAVDLPCGDAQLHMPQRPCAGIGSSPVWMIPACIWHRRYWAAIYWHWGWCNESDINCNLRCGQCLWK